MEAPKTSDQEKNDVDNGLTKVQKPAEDESPALENKEEVTPDETIHESTVDKGLGGALKDRGTLEETKHGGRNKGKRKPKVISIVNEDGSRGFGIDMTDENGQTLTIEEAYRPYFSLIYNCKFSRKRKREAPKTSDQEKKDGDNGLTKVQKPAEDESPALENKEGVTPDETIHESTVDKGLGGALKDRGTLEETKQGGRNKGKRKLKVISIVNEDGSRRFGVDTTDENGQTETRDEADENCRHTIIFRVSNEGS